MNSSSLRHHREPNVNASASVAIHAANASRLPGREGSAATTTADAVAMADAAAHTTAATR